MEGLKRAKAACHRKKYTFPSRWGTSTTTAATTTKQQQLQRTTDFDYKYKERALHTHIQAHVHMHAWIERAERASESEHVCELVRENMRRLTSALSFPLSSHSSAVRLRRIAPTRQRWKYNRRFSVVRFPLGDGITQRMGGICFESKVRGKRNINQNVATAPR